MICKYCRCPLSDVVCNGIGEYPNKRHALCLKQHNKQSAKNPELCEFCYATHYNASSVQRKRKPRIVMATPPKSCIICGNLFHRYDHESKRNWSQHRACSMRCGKILAGRLISKSIKKRGIIKQQNIIASTVPERQAIRT